MQNLTMEVENNKYDAQDPYEAAATAESQTGPDPAQPDTDADVDGTTMIGT